jgi:putative glutamine amidotransferase
MPIEKPVMLIGVSARIYYPSGPVLDLGGVWTKTLHYLEQSVALWLIRGGALPVMIPAFESKSLVRREHLNLRHYVDALDGLVLQGGNDVAPQSYGETPLQPKWQGDAVRDHYEIELIHAFVEAGKPVFGICRGLQVLNVAFGGTLWQDLPTQCPSAVHHISDGLYEKNMHALTLTPGGWLDGLYPDKAGFAVNSIHHQGIKTLASSFDTEAVCPVDGGIEAIRRTQGSFVAGVQWHPEFNTPEVTSHFNDGPMLEDFLREARERRENKNSAAHSEDFF